MQLAYGLNRNSDFHFFPHFYVECCVWVWGGVIYFLYQVVLSSGLEYIFNQLQADRCVWNLEASKKAYCEYC